MTRYSVEPRTEKYVNGRGFLSFGRNLYNKYRKQLLDAATKTGLNPLKTATKKVEQKAAEATGELIGHRIVNKVIKPKPVPDVNSRNAEKITIRPEKGEEILNELR